MSEIIKTENLQYAYPTEDGQLSVPVLKGVNLSIKRGEFVAVLGHNGSGKSTLAGCFNAIRLPTGGVCYVDMMDTRDENNTYEVRKTVAMVFQNPDNQLVATVVEEDVAFALENMGVPPRKSASAWTMHCVPSACTNTVHRRRTVCPADRSSESQSQALSP